MPDCHCLHSDYVPWIYDTFSDCIYSPLDQMAFFFGLSSMAFWLVCQLPQFIKNCRRQSADALSLCFLIEWLGGDVLNFGGSFLSGMLPTQVWLAGWFVVMDVFILGQYIYLYLLNRGRDRPVFVDSDDDDDEAAPLTAPKRAGTDVDDDTDGPKAETRVAGVTGGLVAASRSVNRVHKAGSPNQLALEPSRAHVPRGARRQPANQVQSARAAVSVRSDDAGSSSAGDVAGAATSAQRGRQDGSSSAGDGSPGSVAARGLACAAGSRPALLAVSAALMAVCVALPAAGRAGWISAGGSKPVGVAGVRALPRGGLLMPPQARSAGAGQPQAGRRLEIHSCVANTPATPEQKELGVVGDVMGWVSSALYLTSRLPQVYKNYTRGSVEGLSWLMFLCAFLGNSTALMGILPRMSGSEDWLAEMPFLPGMMGTIALDFTIMGQYFWYTSRATERRTKRKALRDAANAAAEGRGSRDGSSRDGSADGTSASLLLDTPDLIGANARRGLYDMLESPPLARSVPSRLA